MLIDHDNLEEFQDPANYDIENGSGKHPSEAFYAALAQEVGGSVLEIACGTGLATIPIARLGLDVTGADIARPMLDHARAKSRDLPIEWVEADARRMRLGKQFRFIFITGNAFQAFLAREDQEALLATVRAHLEPDGVFAFETRNPSGTDLSTFLDEHPWQEYTDAQGRRVRLTETQVYDAMTQVMHWTLYRRWMDADQQQPRVSRIACRFTYPQELRALLHYNGLRVIEQYGDWQRGQLTAASGTIISICGHRS
jgi:SAM-dependent methyltransferase